MRKIAVYTIKFSDELYAKTAEFFDFLKSEGIEYRLFDLDNLDDFDKSAELIVIFGGDGTVLSAVSRLAPLDIPILGVNLGTIGFLTSFELDELISSFKDISVGKYELDERMLLELSVSGKTIYALNDIVIAKGANTRPISVEARLDGAMLDRYLSDGIIVSTPTGSTAYSLSAGGPILSPDVSAFVVNPVSAHTLHSRPLVISTNHTLGVTVKKPEKEIQLIADGMLVAEGKELQISVKKSDFTLKFITLPGAETFYERLMKKLRRWTIQEELK